MTGLKTGSTSQALFNLSATANRDGLSLIAVVMKAPTSQIRNEEVTTLLNYGFSAYTSKKIASKGEVVDKLKISKNVSCEVEVVVENDEYLISKKGESKEYNKVIEYNKNLKAPITNGTVVGKLKFIDKDGNLLHETNIIVNQDVVKSTLWEYMVYIMNTYMIKELKNTTMNVV